MEFVGSIGTLVAVLGIPIALVSLVFVARSVFKKCPPNTAFVITGPNRVRFVTGGGTVIKPLLETYQSLSLKTFQVEVRVEDTPNIDGVPVTVDAVANLKISSDEGVLRSAAERLLGMNSQEIESICKKTLEALLRQIVGRLTIEAIVKEREKISQETLGTAHGELTKLGLHLDNFAFTRITDKLGYIEAMGKTRTAEVKRDAEIGEAVAKREATIQASTAKREAEAARLANEEQIAEADRNLAVKKAAFRVETETADAQASLARQLKEAEINEGLTKKTVAIEEARIKAQIGVADQEILRKERELQATVLKPAEAERTAAVVRAEGEANAKVLQANADKLVMVARAEADKVRLAAEGEGRAAAEAAQKRQIGEAEATAVRARGEAEAKATEAKLLAEALGLLKKNEALAKMGESAKLILILDRMPHIIETAGEAAKKAIGSAFEYVGIGLSRIDSLHIVDMGGNGANGNDHSPVARYAMAIPDIVFGLMQRAKALGVNMDELLRPLGIDVEKLVGQLGNSGHNVKELEPVEAEK